MNTDDQMEHEELILRLKVLERKRKLRGQPGVRWEEEGELSQKHSVDSSTFIRMQ